MVESIQSSDRIVSSAVLERPIRVLHVDDDPSFLKVAKQCLETQGGIDVDTVSSVNEASEKLKKTDYDAIVCDYQIPGKDGLEFLKELREKGNTIPFIILTGKGREEVAIKALNLGADQYFDKHGNPEAVYCELAHSIRIAVKRKKDKEALAAERDRLETVTRNIGAGLAIISKDYRTLWANDVLKRIFGDVEGKICYSTYNQRNDICPKCGVQEIFENGKAKVVLEQAGKGAHGGTIWSEITATPVKDSDGNVTAVLELVVPITQRKRAEEELHSSAEKYGMLFDEALDAIFVADAETGILIDCNRAAIELVGREKSELIGKHQRILHPSEKNEEEFSTTFKQHLKEKEGQTLETQVITKKGEIKDVAVKANILELWNKRVVQGIFKDITERKKVEEQLRDSEKKYHELFDTSIDAIATSDMDGHFLDCNQSCQKMLGYSLDEMKKLTYQQLTPEKWHEKEAEIIEKDAMKKGYTAEYEKELIRKDGAIIPVSNRVWATFDDDGKPKAMWGIVRDITERKKAQEELRDSEEHQSVLFELSPDAYYLNDLKGNFVDGNKAAEEVTGYTKNELIGKSFLKLKLLPRSQALKAAKLLAMNALGKPTGPDEFVLNRKDGTQVPVEIRTHPVKIKDKTLVLGIARDISIRKKDEQAILESQQKFEGLFRHNPEAAVYLDLDSEVLDVNPRFCELFGYSAKEVKGKRINELVAPEDMIEEAETLDKDAKKGYASRDTVRKRKDGSLVHVSISASPVIIEGRLLGVVGVYKDITKLKNAEERLKKMNKRLEITNEKLHVVGGLTRHDVRNKLSAVTGNAYLLKRKLAEDPEALEQLTDMEAAVRLVERIFEFARTYEKLGVEQPSYMDIGKTVDEAVSLFSDLKGVKIVNECDGLTVLADSLLSQLFYNLVDNSLKYGEKTQQIKIHYRTPSADQVELVYEDDGVGIPDKMRSNLFKEGFTSGKGTGYGLFMIKRMCEVYGWTIQETGKQGKGAQFTMLIPRTSSTGKGDQVQKTQQRQQESATNMEVPNAHSQPHS